MKRINIKIFLLPLVIGVLSIILFLLPNDQIIANAEEETSLESTPITASIDTFVEGTIEWKDDFGIKHPVRGVLVTLYDDELGVAKEKLGECITNNNGEYSIGFQNQDELVDGGGCDVFIEILAGDGSNVKIKDTGGLVQHSFEKGRGEQQHKNIVTGNIVTINHVFYMTNEMGQAVQIGQAVLTARDFAKAMKGSMPQNVNVIYPSSNDTQYNSVLNIIYISNDSSDLDYFDWDVVMHEYGHHVSNEMGISNSIGGGHHSYENMADHCINNSDGCINLFQSEAKAYAVKLVWAESWPTIFGELAQQYFSSILVNITNVKDYAYSDTTNLGQGINYYYYDSLTDYLGEACERSIMAILWDLFDTTNEVGDNISLSYQEWWDITTGYGATTFSDFINDFYTVYPEYIDDIAPNLTKYQMAPKIGGSEYSLEIPRTISWTPQGGSSYFPNNSYTVKIYNTSHSQEISINTTQTSVTLTNEQWNTILGWYGETRFISVVGYQTSTPATGGYYSEFKEYSIFKTAYYNSNGIEITGCLVELEDNLVIPESINGKKIVSIGDWAFQNQQLITSVSFEDSSNIVSIGTGAFYGCSLLNFFNIPSGVDYLGDEALVGCDPNGLVLVPYANAVLTTIGDSSLSGVKLLPLSYFPDNITTIKAGAFSETDFNDDFYLITRNLSTIGDFAFNNSDLDYIALSSNVISIGNNAFNGCSNLTIYTERTSRPSTWSSSWNASNRPVIWGCSFDSTNTYVESVNNTGNNVANGGAPCRKKHDFGGWYTTQDFTGTAYFDLSTAPLGTLYAKWVAEESCVVEGTLVTLVNGSQVAVENLTGNEDLLVWNLNTGSFDSAPILFIDSDELAYREIIHLYFSDGTELKIVDEHALWCFDLNEYVYLDNMASNYVGKYFNKKTADGYTAVQLIDVEIYSEIVRTYSPVTSEHLCYYVNGLLSIPGGISGLFNIYDVIATEMKYDQIAMQDDVATYGLYTYEDFCLEIAEVPEAIFEALGGENLKIAMGKGLINREKVLALIGQYQVFFM